MALACASLAAFSLWLRQGFAVHAVAGAGFDDALFARLAYALGGGQWLGPFDRVTLAKGMFYPLFMALSAAMAVPLKTAEHLVYLAACAGLSLSLAHRLQRPWAGLLLFAALALNPMLWHPALARIIREGLYLSLSLAVLALWASLLLPRRKKVRLPWLLPVCTGLLLTAYWCTREEGVWLLPALATMTVAVLVGGLRRHHRARIRHPRLAPAAVRVLHCVAPLALAGLTGAAGVTVVKAVNHARYGVFVATEFQDSRFKRAYGALARIRHDQRRPYVVFPSDARQRAYAASAAARELQPALEGANGELWREAGCTQTRSSDCPEILSGWFMWALRDAVWLAGHYDSAPRAMAFYERLADEINGACDAGRIACDPPRSTLAPALRAEQVGPTMKAAATIARLLVQLGDGDIGVRPSLGALEDLEYLRQMVGDITPPAVLSLTLTARWESASLSHAPDLRIESGRSAEQATWRVEYQPPALGATAARLRLSTDCLADNCRLRLGDESGPLQTGTRLQSSAGTLRVEDLRIGARTLEGQRTRLQQKVARTIARAYALAWPVLSLVALAGWLLAGAHWLSATGMRSKGHASLAGAGWMLLLATGALVAVATRIVLLAYLEATSIPSANVLYASPAAPMMLLFTVLGWVLGAHAWHAHRFHGSLSRPECRTP